MNGCHQAFIDSEAFFQQHVHQRREAVGRATCIGENMMLGRVILVVVDTHHDRQVLVLAGGGDNHFPGTGLDMAFGFFLVAEQPRRFDDNVDTEFLPRQCRRAVLDGQALDPLAVDDQGIVAFVGDRTGKATLDRVVLGEVREVIGGDKVIDRHHVDLVAEQALITNRTKHQPTNPPKSINTNFNCHDWKFLFGYRG